MLNLSIQTQLIVMRCFNQQDGRLTDIEADLDLYTKNVIALVTTVWFSWGGIRGMRELFRRLKAERMDEQDDGTVINHHNLDE